MDKSSTFNMIPTREELDAPDREFAFHAAPRAEPRNVSRYNRELSKSDPWVFTRETTS